MIVGNVAGVVAGFIDANVVIILDGQVLFMVLRKVFQFLPIKLTNK